MNICAAGHERHETTWHRVTLRGQSAVHEYPPIPEHLAREFWMQLYDHEQYKGFAGYCPGQDDICLGIQQSGIWEGYETLVALQILHEGDRNHRVIDVGAQLGWYTLLAASFGYDVLAVEAHAETLHHLVESAERNGWRDLVEPVLAWIGKDTPPAEWTGEYLLLKADIEGAEEHAVRWCRELFLERRLRYALLEISPCFNASYPALVEWILDCGYAAYMLPSKPEPYVRDAWAANLWGALARCQVDASCVAGLRQENFLFVRRDS